ncbi:MAG: ABC transporter substrate-binding protein [Acidimicrobiales bacterium]|nr:ABC transporter substrate-binding protein [Acidimicrobiales bacterium]
MKKILALLAMLALIAAACGSGSTASSDDGAAADDSAATDDSAADDSAASDDGEMTETLIDNLNVAYFAAWPLPAQIGQADGSFAAAVGAENITWIPLNSGGEMAEAMIAGDVDISYSMGLTPFANNVNNGAELTLVGIAVSYAEADNCIAQDSLGLTRDNAAEVLAGKTVVTPIGNVTHFKMLSIMDFLGVDLSSLSIVPAEGGAATAAAFATGDIDVGCAFGGPVVDMINAGGSPILTGAETESEVGIRTYDINAIPTSFGQENPEVVTNFLKASEQFNQMWASDPGTYNPIIATAAGMEDVGDFLDGDLWFSFPTIEEQLSADWMGGNVAETMQDQLQTFEELGQIDSVLGDFSGFVDTSYLEAAQ